MKKIFITGSEGFVGQYAVKLLQENYAIIGLSKDTPLDSHNHVQYIIGDILSESDIYGILSKHQPDVILHLAGIAKTWNNDPRDVFNINLYGTMNIYESVLKLKQEINYDPKIVYISSAETYGNTSPTDNISEQCLTNPINDYGTSKLAADRLSYQYSQSHKLNIVIVRPFPHIGPGQGKGFFVPDMASQIAEIEKDPTRNEIQVGNLDGIRDYLDVRDVVEFYKKIVESDTTAGEVFNVCSGKGIKIADLLEILLKLSTKQITIQQDQSRVRPLELPVFVGNNEKAKKLGWQPTHKIEETLKEVLDYWRTIT